MVQEPQASSRLGADAGLQGDTFLDPVILPDHRDQFLILAGSQANIALEDAFFPTFTTGIPGHAEAPSNEETFILKSGVVS